MKAIHNRADSLPLGFDLQHAAKADSAAEEAKQGQGHEVFNPLRLPARAGKAANQGLAISWRLPGAGQRRASKAAAASARTVCRSCSAGTVSGTPSTYQKTRSPLG